MAPAPASFDRVIVVHGFRASPQKHWFPWLAQTLPAAEVVALPDSASPSEPAWVGTVIEAIGTLDHRTAVVAHSLGCVTAVRAVARLAAEHAPGSDARLGAFVAVSPFADPLTVTGDDGLDAFSAHGLAPFLDGVDLPATRPHLGRVTVIRSDDDPLVVPQLSDAFARGLDAPVQVVPGAKHFIEAHGVTQVPQVVSALEDPAAPTT